MFAFCKKWMVEIGGEERKGKKIRIFFWVKKKKKLKNPNQLCQFDLDNGNAGNFIFLHFLCCPILNWDNRVGPNAQSSNFSGSRRGDW